MTNTDLFEDCREVGDAVNGFAIGLGNHIANRSARARSTLDFGLGGRRIRQGAEDDNAVDPHSRSYGLARRLDAYPRRRHMAFLDQLRGDPVYDIDRDRKADPRKSSRSGKDGGVHASEAGRVIKQRTAGIAGVYRGIRFG